MSFNLFQEIKYQTKTRQFINSEKVTSENGFKGTKEQFISLLGLNSSDIQKKYIEKNDTEAELNL